ncbi:MAG: DNA polymerase IV [Thermoleophilaceae bacterium]|nr:DNA polymerase IV [Thermoleophilaceae bacterium]
MIPPAQWPRCYALVDMDAFYVSVELLRRPELRGLPVVVAGSGPRAVVTTASYEARRYGVHSATPASRARRLCPQAVFVAPDFDHYRSCSARVMGLLRDHFEIVEVMSLDEAYVDLSGLERPRASVKRARAEILSTCGLNCSVGIGPNKLIAKVASDLEKPNGFVLLDQAAARDRFGPLSAGVIPGVGPKTVQRLGALRIETVAQLGDAEEERLIAAFGPRLGPHLRALGRLEDRRELDTARLRKSESRETTFDRDLRGVEALDAPLRDLARRLCDDMGARGARGQTIGIKVRLDDFSTHTRARTLPSPTADYVLVLQVARELLLAFDPPRPVRLLGVRVAGLDQQGQALNARPQLELTI